MTEKEIIEKLARELGERDLETLNEFVLGKSFVQAFNELKGFNLTSDPITIDGKLMGFNTFFDLNFKSISTTIFMTEDGGCEVYECADVWLDEVPIGHI